MMSQIRTARPTQLDELVSLWSRVFGDDGDLVRAFAALWPCREHAYVCGGKRLEGAVWDIDTGTLSYGGEDKRLSMVYALAVHPEHRGGGKGSSLIAALPEPENGALRCLTPAERSLMGWYKKLGCTPYFYCDRGEIHNDAESAQGSITLIDAQQYARLREPLLSGRVHDVPNQRALMWQQALMADCGGFCRIEGDDLSGLACAYKSDAGLHVSELLVPASQRGRSLRLLMRRFGAERAEWRSPADREGKPFAMLTKGAEPAFPDSVNRPWLGFVFD